MPDIPPRSATYSTERTLISQHTGDKSTSSQDSGPTPPYQLTAEQVATEYEADTTAGLTKAQAEERRSVS